MAGAIAAAPGRPADRRGPGRTGRPAPDPRAGRQAAPLIAGTLPPRSPRRDRRVAFGGFGRRRILVGLVSFACPTHQRSHSGRPRLGNGWRPVTPTSRRSWLTIG